MLSGSLTPVPLPPSAPLEGQILHWCKSAWSCCRGSSPACSRRLTAGFTGSRKCRSLKGNGATDSRREQSPKRLAKTAHRGGHSTLYAPGTRYGVHWRGPPGMRCSHPQGAPEGLQPTGNPRRGRDTEGRQTQTILLMTSISRAALPLAGGTRTDRG